MLIAIKIFPTNEKCFKINISCESASAWHMVCYLHELEVTVLDCLNKGIYAYIPGCTIAEAVTHWPPTVAARVRARVWQVGFVVDKVASGQFFSKYFGFPCQNHSFHQLLHCHHNHLGQVAEALRQADHPSTESCCLS
jgi:hypothetical protein